jgi:hypothetical protein
MKRVFAAVLAAVMMLCTLTACGKKAPNNLEGKSLSEIVDLIYAEKEPGIMVETMDVNIEDSEFLKYDTGLSSADKITAAAVSEAMIGSQAYSMVLVRVADEKDSESVANEMKEGINPAKWICVQADDLKVAVYRDVVMLIMVSSQLADTVTAQEIVDAYKTVCGGEIKEI